MLAENGRQVRWLRESSDGIEGSLSVKIDAFFSAFYNRGARRKMAGLLDRFPIDLVQIQNLYPFLSPSILIPCRERGVPVVMRCPSCRLFLPERASPFQRRGLRALLARTTWTGMKL